MNISWSIDRSLRLSSALLISIQLQRIPVLPQMKLVACLEVSGVVRRALFAAAMEVVCSLNSTNGKQWHPFRTAGSRSL